MGEIDRVLSSQVYKLQIFFIENLTPQQRLVKKRKELDCHLREVYKLYNQEILLHIETPRSIP